MSEIFKLALQAGALGILLVMIVGFGWIMVKVAPEFRTFLSGMLTAQNEITVQQAKISTRLDVVDTGTKASGAATVAAIAKLEDTIRAEGTETRAHLVATETRLTGVVRREQQDPPSSRQPVRRA